MSRTELFKTISSKEFINAYWQQKAFIEREALQDPHSIIDTNELAGIAHWGTALTDDCTTLSIGFRAPSTQELLAETLEKTLPLPS